MLDFREKNFIRNEMILVMSVFLLSLNFSVSNLKKKIKLLTLFNLITHRTSIFFSIHELIFFWTHYVNNISLLLFAFINFQF